MKFICRQSHDFGESLYDYPLSGRYDEMDALAVFDDVLIPWDRVFQFEDMELANLALQAVPMWRQYMQQVAVKNIAKLEFILGITHRIALGIGIEVFSHVQEKIAEIVDILETVRSYLRAAEADAAFSHEVIGLKGEKIEGDGIWPAPEPWIAMRNWYPDAYVRVIWIVEQLAAGGLMLTPTEQDVQGELADEIGKFYSGANLDATERIALFRLAWDLTGTQFGSRQTLYERFFNGDVVRLRQRRFATYDYTRATKAVDTFLAREPVENGAPPSHSCYGAGVLRPTTTNKGVARGALLGIDQAGVEVLEVRPPPACRTPPARCAAGHSPCARCVPPWWETCGWKMIR